MKNTLRRNRDFSATRLSYSRQHMDQSHSHSNISPSHRTHQSKSLLCNNCFNRKTLTKKQQVKHAQKEDDKNQLNLTWTFVDKSRDQKNKMIMRQELKKVNEYNVNKIRENQIKKYEQGNTSRENNEEDTSFVFGEHEKNRRFNEDMRQQRRIELKEDLEKQIAHAKQRRIEARKQNQEMVLQQPLIKDKSRNLQERQRIQEQYKRSLFEQIREHKQKKQKEEYERKSLNSVSNGLKFIREADEKRVQAQRRIKQNKELMKEEYRRKKEIENLQKQEIINSKEQELKARLVEQQRFRDQLKKNEETRRATIENYLQQLRHQMEENKIHRREEFKKLKQTVQSSAIFSEQCQNKKLSKMEPCSCCSKTFPKQFLSPSEEPV